MRICFVDYDITVTGGAEQVSVSLANELCKSHKIYIYSINAENDSIPYTLDKSVLCVWGPKGKKRLNEMIKASFSPFIKFVKREKIDIVLSMGNYPALIVSLTRFFNKAKYVFCDHGALINQWKQKDVTAIRFWDMLLADRVVVLTERTRDDYCRLFYCPKKKVRCIYNWNDVLPAAKDYDADSKKIISVGRFGKEKGYDMLPDIAEKIFRKHPEWEWDVYGDGETFLSVKEAIKERGIDDRVHLRGNQKNVKSLYQDYAFLILPSYREGMPLVLLEAKANRLPLLSFDILTGPREIIRDGIDGYLIPPYNVEKMAEKAVRLIEDKELRKRMSDNSQDNLDKFSKEEIEKKWMALFAELKKK